MKKTVLSTALLALGMGVSMPTSSQAFYYDSPNYSMVKNMYSSGTASEIGDLVTITISQSASSTKSNSHSASKSNQFDLSGSGFPATSTLEWQNKFNRLLTLDGFKIDSSSSSDGAGDKANSESFTTTITARVVDKLPNGNLVVRGERFVHIRKEKTTVTLTGIIRARDISRTNLIDSNMISDARIYYETEGNLEKLSEPGWLSRFLSTINPF